MEEVPRRTSLVPLAFPCCLHCLIGVETEGLLDYQRRAGDHFHCEVEPSPGHIRSRTEPSETPAEPSEMEISSESLAEGCAPRMVTLRNFRSG